MANVQDHVAGRGGGANQRMFYDQGNGTWAEAFAALWYAWNGTGWQRLTVDADGALPVTVPTQTLLNAAIDTASSGDNTIVAADTTKKIKVVSYVLVAAGAVSTRWKSGATTKSGAMPLAANGGAAIAAGIDAPVLETAVNNALVLNLSGATQVSGHVSYFLEA